LARINGLLSAALGSGAPNFEDIPPLLAACVLITLSITGGSSVAFSQNPNPSPAAKSDAGNPGPDPKIQNKDQSTSSPDQQKGAQGKQKKEKRGSLIVAPIPISSPAFGSGLLLIVGYVFQFDKEDRVSPPSWAGASGVVTNNGTRALALGGKLYLKENKYQTTFTVMKGRANLDFFGIGRIPGREAVSVPLSMEGTIVFGEAMRNIGKNIFVGPRYQYRRLTATIEGGQRIPGGFEVPDIDLKSSSAALGFHFQRDKRNSTFYPTKGTLIDSTADFFDKIWGSRRVYQSYKVAYNGFHEIARHQVLAYRAMGCSANGSVPFYDLCLYGFNNDLRGYATGEFQNRRMFAAQAEYRLELRKRLGVVAFGGVGGVAQRWSDFRSDSLLPGGGVGLRFKLDKKNHINYRVDFAVGRDGYTISIGVGEAF
jgi:hypothetical protein